MQGDDVQAVIEVAAKASLLHPAEEVLICGGEDAHIHWNGVDGADADHLPLLQDPQQLRLKGGAHSLDFVKKQRALVGTFK